MSPLPKDMPSSLDQRTAAAAANAVKENQQGERAVPHSPTSLSGAHVSVRGRTWAPRPGAARDAGRVWGAYV